MGHQFLGHAQFEDVFFGLGSLAKLEMISCMDDILAAEGS